MFICPVCGWLIILNTENGTLLTHGPENMINGPAVCTGSGLKVVEMEAKVEAFK
jgi:hypothetical protein